jgi:serine-type D-Ala-D-Ala carboxypeptidase/endopeptidase (penicillin-binding protein 4)
MKIKSALLCFCLTLIFVVYLTAQNPPPFNKERYNQATVSMLLYNVKTGKTIAACNPDMAVMPASLFKLITTATALEMLGPDFRFTTKLEYSGKVTNGTLNGDVIIRGGGDPTLGSRHLSKNQTDFLKDWVAMVKKAGIQKIDGRIIADASVIDDENVSPYWLWEDLGNYYAAGCYGLNVFDNSYTLFLRSENTGSTPTVLFTDPVLPEMVFDNHLLAASNSKDSAYLYGIPYDWKRTIHGSIPANRDQFSIRGDLPDPPLVTANIFRQALVNQGVEVEGLATTFRNSLIERLPVTVLGRYQSIPLSDIITITLEKSDNQYAECLLRQLAVSTGQCPATFQRSIQIVRSYWASKQMDVSSLNVGDGSGLSPYDRVSARFLSEVLRYMVTASRHASLFETLLPLAGKQGTVAGFLKNTSLEGRLRLKSGSNSMTLNYAGYYPTAEGLKVIVMMVNQVNLDRKQVNKDLETFLLKH